MCKQNFAWPEQLKTHIRTKHRAELMARAGNYKKEIREEEEEAKKQPDSKSVARMKTRLPGGISVQSLPADKASERRVLDFQAKHPGLSISSKNARTQPSTASVTRVTQLSRPGLISKAKVTQSVLPKEVIIGKLLVPSNPKRISVPNMSQSIMSQRISMPKVSQSMLPQRISMSNILPKSILMAKVSQPSLPKRISIGNVKQQQWTNTRNANTNQARASWWGR